MFSRFPRSPIALAALMTVSGVYAEEAAKTDGQTLETIVVNASADASAEGLSKPYAGGQVARGGRAGILGTQDNMDVPFNITSYTNQLIQDQQARTIGDVLKNDPSVRVARGFGNFQESYFIRGFILASDEIAYNGLYSILPRQSIATELVERVEVLRGASTFLTGAAPGGGGIGGTINILPKRAGNEPLTQVSVSGGTGGDKRIATDISRRFGPDDSVGIRINAAHGEGGTGVDREKDKIDVFSVGADWHSRDVRLSADIGYQNNKLNKTRTSVSIGSGLTSIPDAPDNQENWAQNWTHSYERDVFGTVRGEYDINKNWTAWAAVGARKSKESNVLDNFTLNNAATGDATSYRADNYREDTVKSGEIGLRGKVQTGSVSHALVASASTYILENRGAYAWSTDFSTGTFLPNNLYNPVQYAAPATTGFSGGNFDNPLVVEKDRLNSLAIGDTMGFLNDRLLVTLGARHQSFDIRGYDYNTGAALSDSSYDRSRVSPVVGVLWKLQNNLSLYANYIESLAKASAPDSSAVNRTAIFSPYVSKQKEIGAKYDAGRIGASIALFSTSKPSGVLDAVTKIYSIDGEDRHQGVELSVYGEATKSMRVLGGVTFLDAKQRDTASGANDGKRVIGVPEIQSNLGVEWDVPGVRGLALDSQVIYTGRTYADAANTLSVPSWTRLDLGARYVMEVGGKVLTLRARVDNVTDRDYWSSVGGSAGSGYLTAGNPRTIVVGASMDF